MRAILVALLVLGACSDRAHAAEGSTAGEFPLTFENCGERVTVAAPPQRVFLLGADSVPLLEAAGALDRVASKAGPFFDVLYREATNQALDRIPSLDSTLGESGGVEIALEAVIATNPDLVIGYETDTLTREALAAAGIPFLVIPEYCSDPARIPTVTSFDYIYDQVAFYGRLFDTTEIATTSIGELRDRIARVERSVARAPAQTAATLFVGLDGYLAAYGARSIAQVQMGTVGLANVFADVDDRVFEIGLEELLARNPDVLILLHVHQGSREEITDVVAGLPGAADVTAVRNKDILVQNGFYSIPATPLAIEGTEHMAEAFGAPPA
ncbi:MAG: ABC transporter substrate-binding protein [Egibacteraceae bacterium]